MRIKQRNLMICFIFIALLLAGCGQTTPTASLPEATEAAAPTEPAAPTTAAPSGEWLTTDAGQIQFLPNATNWYTPGNLSPKNAIRFSLATQKGQQMTVRLATEPASTDVPMATLYIAGADGQVFTFDPTTYWSNILPTGQDYIIEVRSLAEQEINYTVSVEISAEMIDPALGNKYELVDPSICQMLREETANALGVEVGIEERAPFLDAIAGEAGQGCRLTARGNGNTFTSAQAIIETLVNSVGLGWTVQPAYQADGPTGSAAGLTRDMGLMLIQANWAPDMGVVCPTDQPITDCNLTPEQKIFTIQIDVAQYRADFSLDGQWEDAATGFSLTLFQDWKNIYGNHLIVAQGGNKIDSLDASITGSLQGQTATVQFQSSFAASTGTAEITYVDPNTITWKIITPPDGEYYLPAEATLTRK